MPLLNDDVLKFDAFDTAEKITGKSHKADKETELLGLALHIGHSEDKKARLKESCDTYYGQTLENYLHIVYELGFKPAYSEEIPPKKDEDKLSDAYFIYYHPDGIILEFDSYWGMKSVNGGRFFYNWRPNLPKSNNFRVLSSGTYAVYDDETNNYIWSGNHDCREAIKYNIEKLREHGTFVTPWVDCPIHWFSHYGDRVDNDDFLAKGDMYRKLSKPRIEAFSSEVKELFGPVLTTLGNTIC